MSGRLTVGVLALQGAFARHLEAFGALGVAAVEVRTPAELAEVDALVIPGGESTAMSLLMKANGLEGPLRERLGAGMPTMGTCAGMIMLAEGISDGRGDQLSFGAIAIHVRRNGFGRQVASFEEEIEVECLEGPGFPAVFIRAPVVEKVGPGVEVLARVGDVPVLCRQGNVLASSFHPELREDRRIHQLFLSSFEVEP